MIKAEVAQRHIRDAEWQVAHGNPKGALALYRRVFKAGHVDAEAFARYRGLHRSVHGEDLPHGEVFDFVYSAGMWGKAAGDAVGSSGWGSSEAATGPYRNFLATFLRERAIATVVEVGCGDWQLGRLIDWSGIEYVGIDVSSVVMKNTRGFAAPNVRFIEGDARTMDLPRADLLLVKDVLQHWTNDDILRFLPKLGGFRFALVTNGMHPDTPTPPNRDIQVGAFREVNLALPPFSVAGTFVLVFEMVGQGGDGRKFRERKHVFLVDNSAP